MSFDSFESSTLGLKALEAQKKREEEEKKRKAEEAARRAAQKAKEEDWREFQKSIEEERDTQGISTDTQVEIPRLVRGLHHGLLNAPEMATNTPNDSASSKRPGSDTSEPPRLKRY